MVSCVTFRPGGPSKLMEEQCWLILRPQLLTDICDSDPCNMTTGSLGERDSMRGDLFDVNTKSPSFPHEGICRSLHRFSEFGDNHGAVLGGLDLELFESGSDVSLPAGRDNPMASV